MSNVTEPVMFYRHEHIFSILILAFTTLVGIPGNALVLWVTGMKMKWTVTTICFANLALADFICCLSIPLSIVQLFYVEWLYGSLFCKILPFTLILNMFTSVFTLGVISVDRCILVLQPVWAQMQRSLRMAWMACLATWMLSFLLCLPVAFHRSTFTYGNITLCHYRQDINMDAVTLTRMVFGFLIPLTVISVSYTCLAFKIKKNRFSMVSKKTTKVAFGIVVAFFITWAPYHIVDVVLMFKNESSTLMETLDLLSLSMAHFNSCINPILYVFMGKDMKWKVKQSIYKLMENAFNEDLSRSLTILQTGYTRCNTTADESVHLEGGSCNKPQALQCVS